jgi:hypothetical protein
MMGDCYRRAAVKSRLHRAALVKRTALFTVLIAQMRHHMHYVLAAMTQRVLYHGLKLGFTGFLQVNVVRAAYVNFHG